MRTVFLFWRNAHDLKSALFIRFDENLRPVSRIWEICRSKMRFGQNVLRMTWKERFVQFLWKAHCFPVLAKIWGQFHDFENFGAQKSDLAKTCCAWPEKRVLYNFLGKRTVFLFWRNAHDLKRASCKIFMEGALFSRFRENFRPVWRFWELWRSKMRFGQNVLRMTWKERFVQFSWRKCTVFSLWREFEASFTILRTLALKNKIWPKRAAHDLKRAFCTICIEGALFSRFGENSRPAWRFWKLSRSKIRFGQNVLRMTWKQRFCNIFMESALFSRFDENFRPRWRFLKLWT